MLLHNVQNDALGTGVAQDTGIYIGVPLYNINDENMVVSYYFWVFNSGSDAKILTVKGCDPTKDCILNDEYSVPVASTVSFDGKTRKVVKLLMTKSTTLGNVKLAIGAGVNIIIF